MSDEISFLPDVQWNMDRFSVTYHAEQGQRLILCRISIEALQDGWPREQHQRPEDTFEAHRGQIEEMTRELIKRARFEPDGTVLVRSEDVRHLA